MKYPVVEVLWADSHTDNDWTPLRDARVVAVDKNALRMQSVGFLVENHADYLLLAGTFSGASDDELVNLTIQIPRACVTDLNYLTVADDRAPL